MWVVPVAYLRTPLAPQLGHVTLIGRFLGMVKVVLHFWHRMVMVAPASAAGAAAAGAAPTRGATGAPGWATAGGTAGAGGAAGATGGYPG